MSNKVTGYIRQAVLPGGIIIPIFLDMEYGMYYGWAFGDKQWLITNPNVLADCGAKLTVRAYKAKVDRRLLCSGIEL